MLAVFLSLFSGVVGAEVTSASAASISSYDEALRNALPRGQFWGAFGVVRDNFL